MKIKKIRNVLLISLGILLLGIAAVGIFVPIWPTTPFVILAAGCFSVNPKIHARIMQIRFFREHITNYKKRTGLPKGNVIFSLSFLWVVLFISMFLTGQLWAVVLLAAVGIAVTIHIGLMSRPKKKIREESYGNSSL